MTDIIIISTGWLTALIDHVARVLTHQGCRQRGGLRGEKSGLFVGHNFFMLYPANLIFVPNYSFSHNLYFEHKNID